jgi:hypothetical protein
MVRVICSLMLSRADGSTRIAWRGDKTSKALAKLWGVSWHWVRKLASEASRRIQFVTNPDEVREFLGLIAFETLSDVRNMHPMDRADAFQKITNAWRPILYPQKHEHSGPGGRPLGLAPEIAALNPSPEELEHFVMVLPEACEVPGCRIHAATRKLLEKENPDG